MIDANKSPQVNLEVEAEMEEVHLTLFNINFPLALCYVTIVVILSIIGVCGNSFIIFVMKKEKHMNKEARSFITNMAIADLCVSGIADPMCIAGAFLGMDYLHGGFWFCVVVASMCLTACICVFLNVLSLTVNRWIFMCHTKIYDRIYSRKSTIAICIATWVIGFGAEMPNFFGFGGHYFDEKSHQCIWNRTASRAYTLFVAFGLITSPLVLLAYCNFAMLRKIWTVKRNIIKNSSEGTSTLKNSWKSAKILLTMFVVFIVCWTPYVIVIVADHGDTFPLEAHLLTTLLAHSHSSSSCLIYLGFKKNFRGYLQRLFQRSRVAPSISAQTTDTQNNANHTMVTRVQLAGNSRSEKGNELFQITPVSKTKRKLASETSGHINLAHALSQSK